jgi:asparagine synthase (glutamine-hydrolysing)
MIPPPSASDPPAVHERYAEIKSGNSDGIKGETYYGYRTNLVEEVKLNMEQFGINLEEENIFLIKGLIQETLHIDEPVALAHIDVDWYESVLCALQRLVPKLIPGGSLVIDDYYHYEGCKMATDEFFRNKGKHFVLNNIAGSMVVTRRKRRFGIFRL